MSSFKKIKIIKPDDCHVHLRDEKILKKVLRYTERFYQRAIIMPNLDKPIIDCKKAIAYKSRIMDLSKNTKFEPLMTCYLTKDTSLNELKNGFFNKIFIGAKLYPNQSTTNSKTNINNLSEIFHILELMQKIKMPLLIHGEENHFNIDIYDREAQFIDKTLVPLRKIFPELKIILEHITTKEAVSYIKEANSSYLAGTITPHHLMLNRNNMFFGGIQPHLYCLPILKRKIHQNSLKKAISDGNKNFFLGSDSAPHLYTNKINPLGCAGIFNAPSSLLCYVTIFEEMKALKYLESFCSKNGANFYNIPINKESITLIKKPSKILEKINIGKNFISPFLSGEILHWSIL
ncbi:dihydroorotase [Buchnera aphidicola]|uniref:Dihydroorotase n=1 Tax=Buchnera aphidicola (Aphis aurantii) TaxID=1470492 RepID=A0AAU6W5S2_9GAMM